MKKLAIVFGFLLLFAVFSVSAQISVDAGLGLSMAYIDADTLDDDSEFGEVAGIFATLLSLRGGFYGDLRYSITDNLSVGGELGFYSMSIEDSDGTSISFVDIPARALVRFGKKQSFIQASAGYYLPLNSPFGGAEVGGKVSLAGLYAAGYYTMGEYTFPRFEIGYQYSNLLNL